jgi:hypothetical protein
MCEFTRIRVNSREKVWKSVKKIEKIKKKKFKMW